VIEVLAAFVRWHSLPKGQMNPPARFPSDVLAAIVALERRNRLFDEQGVEIDLRYANLSYLRLPVGADLRGVTLAHSTLDHVHLRGADLTDVDLQGTSLTYARLERACLNNSQLLAADLTHAQLLGADLRGARLAGAMLHKTVLIDADLRGANLRSFDGYDRHGELVSYRPADPGVDFENAANLSGAVYDDETKWPNLPPGSGFDPEARGAQRA